MKGKYDIVLSTNKVTYRFTLERNITILVGNSGTGKTTLWDLFFTLSSRIKRTTVKCNYRDKLCVIRNEDKWKEEIEEQHNKIFIFDEGLPYVQTYEFAEVIQNSDNYFIIISRSGRLGNLTYSVDSIYELKTKSENG